MGEARRRGTFEQRKAQAIAEGRVKREPEKRRLARRLSGPKAALLELLSIWQGPNPRGVRIEL